MRVKNDLVELMNMRQSPGWEIMPATTMVNFYQLMKFLSTRDYWLDLAEAEANEEQFTQLMSVRSLVTRALDLMELLNGEDVGTVPREWQPEQNLKDALEHHSVQGVLNGHLH